ncbi:MAG: F0F1 ATP synthase subunit epsilon [bacterium]|nr:F0F1 ATP synthase subunit epsilon [bacterium]
MELKILTPSERFTETSAEEITAHGPKGEFGILPGYTHFITPLGMGPLRYTKDGKEHSLFVEGGFMEIFEETVVVAADHVELSRHLQPEQKVIETRLQELETQLGSETLSPDDFRRLSLQRDREQARLAALGH